MVSPGGSDTVLPIGKDGNVEAGSCQRHENHVQIRRVMTRVQSEILPSASRRWPRDCRDPAFVSADRRHRGWTNMGTTARRIRDLPSALRNRIGWVFRSGVSTTLFTRRDAVDRQTETAGTARLLFSVDDSYQKEVPHS